MMKSIKPDDWIPTDSLTLEANALTTAKSAGNRLVVAGPGAGKTELLAQRACFLLQTNTCKFPHKILAISFKRDAAFNLKERVRLRCGDELAKRFDSYTFDSFAKHLLDRFRLALPSDYKVSANYDVILSDAIIRDIYKGVNRNFFYTAGEQEIMSLHTGSQLPLDKATQADAIVTQVWNSLLTASPSRLSFKMIMRLAEFIINANPKITEFLQQTYHYVFLDEFQDTTSLQFDFFKSCFLNSSSIFTAVGDDKQRIMTWAGANDAIFNEFITETEATRVPLKMNFRSAPRLVSLFNYLAKNLLGQEDMATPSPKWNPDAGECDVWMFESQEQEARVLFEAVRQWIEVEGINPREICILVKQRLDDYAGALIDCFVVNGIKARDESKYQDLLTREISLYVFNCIYAIFDKKLGEAKRIAFSFLSNLHTEYEDDQLLQLEISFHKFIKRVREDFDNDSFTVENVTEIVDEVIAYADFEKIRSAFVVYKNVKILKGHIENIVEELTAAFENSTNMIDALDTIMGKDTVPVMTVHKSKGLEYHSVIFVGLEDGAFWTFQRQPDEDKRTFFVALSRAKERVIFTFSKVRTSADGQVRTQNFKNIQVIFEELQKSNIVKIEEKNL